MLTEPRQLDDLLDGVAVISGKPEATLGKFGNTIVAVVFVAVVAVFWTILIAIGALVVLTTPLGQ